MRKVRVVEIGDPYTIILRTIMRARPKFYIGMSYLRNHHNSCTALFIYKKSIGSHYSDTHHGGGGGEGCGGILAKSSTSQAPGVDA